MGKKSKPKRKVARKITEVIRVELVKDIGDFTSEEDWDSFYSLRGVDDPFEWYATWPQLRGLLTECLLFPSSDLAKSPAQRQNSGKLPADLRILVPGCGNSSLSEHLYDAGFLNITNVDFSRVVIKDMLKKNVRERPEMKWRVMDMTKLKFHNETFDAVVDKGGLDSLMATKIDPRLGNHYLYEVKRVLKTGGKYICVTLAESHVLDLLFPKFRFGWKMSLYTIAQQPSSSKQKLQTFVVIFEKDQPSVISHISSLDNYLVECHGAQARKLYEALEMERKVRAEYFSNDVWYTLEDLKLGAKGNMAVYEPGRRMKLILCEPGVSTFFNKGILFDAKKNSGYFIYHYGVYIIPQAKAHDWLFTSEEGQWRVVASLKAARLLMVFLDTKHSMETEDIQAELFPFARQLAPGYIDEAHTFIIPFLAAGDGINREIVYQVLSDLTGQIIVEDLSYLAVNDHKFRRLTFKRAVNRVQSEVLLSTKGSTFDPQSHSSDTSSGEMEIVHNFLASQYHNGVIAGMVLISTYMILCESFVDASKDVIIGLGAGLLPMFMRRYHPTLKIEVFEIDPVVVDVAKEYFEFQDDELLKVHTADGIEFVKELAGSEEEDKIDILIVDVASSDTSSGLTCPDEKYVEQSFILAARESLSEQGVFVINLISRSSSVKDAVISRLKKVFRSLFRLKLDGDVNEVIFGLKSDDPINEEMIVEAREELATTLLQETEPWSQRVLDLSKSVELLK